MTSVKKHYVDKYLLDPRHMLTVEIHGTGGTGSFLLSKLARLNVFLKEVVGHPGLHVVAYDPDIIESHNFVRSTFSPFDAKMQKASTIVTRINRYYGLKWVGVDRKKNTNDNNSNIVFFCVDSLSARKSIVKNTMSHGYHSTAQLYTIDIGNERDYGQVVITAGNNVNANESRGNGAKIVKYAWELFDSIVDKEDKPSCSMKESLNAQSLFINEFMAVIAAEMFKELIVNPVLLHNVVFANLNYLQITKMMKE